MDSRSEDFIHIIRLDPGEKIMESLLNYLEGKQDILPSGFLSAIGATSNCEIGWYSIPDDKYQTTVIGENCEIVGIIGNIAWIDGVPVVHAHITLGKEDYSTVGGHLIEGTVSVTCEIYIHKVPIPVSRASSEKFSSLKLIEFKGP